MQTIADDAITLAEFDNKFIKFGKNSSAKMTISPLKCTARQLTVTQVSRTTCDRRSLMDSFKGDSNVRKDTRKLVTFTFSN